jgi:hypothetical protein
MSEASQWVEVYAVVRYDHYLGDDAASEAKVAVKEILPTRDEAEREVERLNNLEAGRGSTYFWQYTRYYPQGCGAVAEQ